VATAIILNSIPLATNPNGALLLTWLLDTSSFPSRYNLLAPRFTPHLSHLCTHKLASLTVLRIVNQKIEPNASTEIVEALFSSPGDHVLADVLGDQVNGVAVVHKILTSPFIDLVAKNNYVEATKRVLIELKVIATQAYRRLIEEVGLPVPNFQPTYSTGMPGNGKAKSSPNNSFGVPGLPSGYPSNDQGLASMMAALQMGGQNPQAGPAQLQIDPAFGSPTGARRNPNAGPGYSPADPYNPFGMRSAEASSPRAGPRRSAGGMPPNGGAMQSNVQYGAQSPSLSQAGAMLNMGQPAYPGMQPQSVPPHLYQAYMYQAYQQNPQNMGTYQ
jgi:protein JSN1